VFFDYIRLTVKNSEGLLLVEYLTKIKPLVKTVG